jgi:hypothetical protein
MLKYTFLGFCIVFFGCILFPFFVVGWCINLVKLDK